MRKMRKIIVKLPDERVPKFRLQRHGWVGRRYLRASSLLNRLDGALKHKELKEKTAIVVKEGRIYKGRYKGTIINESMDSTNPYYLLYTTACFLEDYITRRIMRPIERRYLEDYEKNGI